MTPAQLRLALSGRMGGDGVADVIDQLERSPDWVLADLELGVTDVRLFVVYLPTGEGFTLTANRVAA